MGAPLSPEAAKPGPVPADRFAIPSVPASVDEFKEVVAAIESNNGYEKPVAFALGVATVEATADGGEEILDVHFTRRNYGANFGTAAVLARVLGYEQTGLETGGYLLSHDEMSEALGIFTPFHGEPGHLNIDTLQKLNEDRDIYQGEFAMNPKKPILGVVRSWEDKPAHIADSYLRLQALSERVMLPNSINLDGMFGKLPNVVRTQDHGVFTPEMWNALEEDMVLAGLSRTVISLDKLPYMLDRVVPSGTVRVAASERVRLGAHLADGTTVMQEGFANFNSGTLGESMVEGRISAGVVVGPDSDIGGGASIMGTLSGGGTEKITVGERSLLGANSGIGISIGDDCKVEAGLYVTAGTVVEHEGRNRKALELSGINGVVFYRDSRDGIVKTKPNTEAIQLNPELHGKKA